jgi:hypothetical protein
MPKTPEEIAAEAKAAADKLAADKAAQDAANGFPSETPLDQMTVDQREAYWRHQARKHENTVKSRADYDELKQKATELEQLQAANATAEEKALEEARREGENTGAQRYLKDAVTAKFQAITGKDDDETAVIFGHVDPLSFTNDRGDIDKEKLAAYAATFGPVTGSSSTSADPVREALERQRAGGSGSGSGSIKEMQKQRVEKLQKK